MKIAAVGSPGVIRIAEIELRVGKISPRVAPDIEAWCSKARKPCAAWARAACPRQTVEYRATRATLTGASRTRGTRAAVTGASRTRRTRAARAIVTCASRTRSARAALSTVICTSRTAGAGAACATVTCASPTRDSQAATTVAQANPPGRIVATRHRFVWPDEERDGAAGKRRLHVGLQRRLLRRGDFQELAWNLAGNRHIKDVRVRFQKRTFR